MSKVGTRGQHTPTPWTGDKDQGIQSENRIVVEPHSIGWLPDLHFIVRACNAHDDLLAACKLAAAQNVEPWATHITKKLRAAIAAATKETAC